MGSKRRIAKEILPIILKDRKDGQLYIEPFAGGMNCIDKVGGTRWANDSNHYLIAMWKELLNGWIPKKINILRYEDIRDNPSDYLDSVVGWVGFICSYRGKFFNGFAGRVETKDGEWRDYQEEASRNILKQVPKLQDICLTSLNYSDMVIPDGSIVYCDPPYAGTTAYYEKFNSTKFWEWVREISKKNTVFVSEYAAPDDFECVWSKELKSSISNNGKSGGFKTNMEKLWKLSKS